MLTVFLVALALEPAAAQQARNTWPAEYARRDAAAFAAEFEEPSRPLFRYRAAMAGLMQVKPGMQVGEVGAGSGYFSRFLAERVGPDGRVFANELEEKMVVYMEERAAAAGLANFTAVKGTATSTGFARETLDAVAVVFAYSFFDHQREMLASIHQSLKPGGVLLIVDIPEEQVGSRRVGSDVAEVEALAGATGFTREAENGVVPGHYALVFRKPGDGSSQK